MCFRIHVRRAVHRQNTFLRHQIVHHREDALLDLAGILRTSDNDKLLLIINHDRGFTVNAINLGNALESRCSQDRKIRIPIICQLFRCRTNQQLMNEQILTSHFVNDTELLGASRIRTSKTVKYKDIAILQISYQLLANLVKLLTGDGHIYASPRDGVMHSGSVYNKLVLRRTSGIFSGQNGQRTRCAQLPFSACQRMLNQLGNAQVMIHILRIDDTIFC